MKEIRDKKFGGSMKSSEYKLLIRLARDLKLSQVDVIMQGLNLLKNEYESQRNKGLFEPEPKKRVSVKKE